jgi:hypothetical protein
MLFWIVDLTGCNDMLEELLYFEIECLVLVLLVIDILLVVFVLDE